MKILIVGHEAEWSIEQYYVKYLREAGCDVRFFPLNAHYNLHAIGNKILNRLGIHTFYRKTNTTLIEQCILEEPDFVWIFKGVELFPETLKKIKNLGIRLVNYNPDHPLIRTSISHGGDQMERSIPLYDAHFCYSQLLVKHIMDEYGVQTFYLPFAFEPSKAHNQDTKQSADILKVCMVGNGDQIRAHYIKQLLKNQINVTLYGNYWRRYLKPTSTCEIFPPVYGNDFWQVLLNYRVQLNVFRPHNVGSHNMRTFEIPSIGGLQVAPFSPEHAEFFRGEEEIWMYQDENEMVQKSQLLLNLSTAQVNEFRSKAKTKCQVRDYTYKHRSTQVIQYLESIQLN